MKPRFYLESGSKAGSDEVITKVETPKIVYSATYSILVIL